RTPGPWPLHQFLSATEYCLETDARVELFSLLANGQRKLAAGSSSGAAPASLRWPFAGSRRTAPASQTESGGQKEVSVTLLLFTLLVGAGSVTAGFLGALTGLGGGVVLVPMLLLVFGV